MLAYIVVYHLYKLILLITLMKSLSFSIDHSHVQVILSYELSIGSVCVFQLQAKHDELQEGGEEAKTKLAEVRLPGSDPEATEPGGGPAIRVFCVCLRQTQVLWCVVSCVLCLSQTQFLWLCV